jgi:hypothetical protein
VPVKTISLMLLLIALLSPPQKILTARDYYNELYNAGRLDRLADLYACFFDDPKDEAFFIFAEGIPMRNHLKKIGQFNVLPEDEQDLLDNDYLVSRYYFRGVSKDRVLMTKKGAIWVGDWDQHHTRRPNFFIDQRTLHFNRSEEVVISNPASNASNQPQGQVTDLPIPNEHIGNFGKCEKVATRIQQHGPEN